MTRFFNPDTICPPFNPYSHGVQLEPGSTLLYMAGQVGADKDGNLPKDFEGQIRNIYGNIAEILKGADMDLSNLVKVTTFLTDRTNLAPMRSLRSEILGDHHPAHTLLIVVGLADPDFLMAVEAIGAAQV